MLRRLAKYFFSRNVMPYWCVLLADCCIIAVAAIFSLIVDRGPNINLLSTLKTISLYMVCYLVGFRVMHTYRGVLRYSSFVDLFRIGIAMLIGTVLVFCARVFLDVDRWIAPLRMRELMVVFVVGTALMCALRVFVKYFYDRVLVSDTSRRAYIYGVKRGGIGLAKDINNEEPKRFRLCGFIADERDVVGKLLMGVKVYGIDDPGLVARMTSQEVRALLVSPLRREAFVANPHFIDALLKAGISIYMLDEAEKWDEKSDLSARKFHEVDIEDLLPRDEIEVDLESVGAMLRGKTVMITGAAGSIGSEMMRQVAQFAPSMIVAVDEAETPQHDMRLMMKHDYPDTPCATIVTSICRKGRMRHIFATYKPQYVFHAAAYKHVPMMEDNPIEAVENNVEGTRILADLAVEFGVKKFVMISTDKAVNPTNVMGCSKRICEIYVQSLDHAEKSGAVHGDTQFVTTRFGNVLGSNGSVIPLFREQIKKGGPVTVTHPDIIRYFMLIPEACKLVLEAGTMGHGGEIFVFDMGKPVKIADLARRMIRLSGAKGVEIKYTGLRDGEKLYEEVLDDEESVLPTFNPKIKIARVREYDYAEICSMISDLVASCADFDDMKTVGKMKKIVPEYVSRHSKYEALDKGLKG